MSNVTLSSPDCRSLLEITIGANTCTVPVSKSIFNQLPLPHLSQNVSARRLGIGLRMPGHCVPSAECSQIRDEFLRWAADGAEPCSKVLSDRNPSDFQVRHEISNTAFVHSVPIVPNQRQWHQIKVVN